MQTEQREFLRVKTIAAMLDISRGSVWGMVRAGKFPKPMKMSPQITVWNASDVKEFIDNLNMASNAKRATA